MSRPFYGLKMWPVVKSKLSGFTFIYLIFTWNKNPNITQITQTRQIDKTLQYIQIYQIIVIKVISTLLPLLSYNLSYEIYMKFVAKLYDSSSLLSTRSRAWLWVWTLCNIFFFLGGGLSDWFKGHVMSRYNLTHAHSTQRYKQSLFSVWLHEQCVHTRYN